MKRASKIAVLTGAGISAESGIPTFRGDGGLWKDHKPEELATPEAFLRDPRLVWEWYDWRRQAIATAKPNPAHFALVELERQKPHFTLVTQNVDGLHDRAGSGRVLKLHGDIWRLRCLECRSDWPDRRAPLPKLPPHCRCGGMARPGVVWVGELPGMWLGRSTRWARRVLLVIGTSAAVHPAGHHGARGKQGHRVQRRDAHFGRSGLLLAVSRATAAQASGIVAVCGVLEYRKPYRVAHPRWLARCRPPDPHRPA
jgi:NAD-dependent deacetylase